MGTGLLVGICSAIGAITLGLAGSIVFSRIHKLTPAKLTVVLVASVVLGVAAGTVATQLQVEAAAPPEARATQSSVHHESAPTRDATTAPTDSATPSETASTQAEPDSPPAAAPTDPDAAAGTGVDHFVVGTNYGTPAVPCCKVGPNTYQLQDDGRTSFGYNWSARTADNTVINSQNCAIIITISGPQDVPGIRKPDCTVTGSNGFSNYGNIVSVAEAGTYVVTVRDAVSGATGSVKVSVVK